MKRQPMPKEPSALALALRQRIERAKLGLPAVQAPEMRFETLDGLAPADWMECRRIEKQMG